MDTKGSSMLFNSDNDGFHPNSIEHYDVSFELGLHMLCGVVRQPTTCDDIETLENHI